MIKNNHLSNKQILLYLIAYFIIIDLLFFPYLSFVVIPYSLPIAFISLLFFAKLIKDKTLILFLVIYITIFISTLLSVFLNIPTEYLIENIKRAFQFLSTFIYFFLFKYIFRELKIKLKPIILLFALYILVLIVIFIVDPSTYLKFRNTVYPLGASELGEFLFFSRFDYMFQDPNTAGYFILLILFFAIANLDFNIIGKLFLIFVSIMTVVATKSVGATLSIILFIGFYFFNYIKRKRIKFSPNHLLSIFILLFVTLMFLAFNKSVNLATFNQAFEDYFSRIEMADSNNESRIIKYTNLINEFYPFLIGSGYTLISEGEPVKPHNDHFRLIYSYGIICYITVLYLFFKKIFAFKSSFIIPAFIAFSVNTLIDEQKFLALFLILLSYSYVYSKKDRPNFSYTAKIRGEIKHENTNSSNCI